jgi:hypothetical protein
MPRNFLHSMALEISHPVTNETLSFSRPLPSELQEFIVSLEQKD